MAMILGLAAWLAACGTPGPRACPVDGARYVLREGKAYSARFRKVAGAPSAKRLVLDIRSDRTGRTYSFTINRGNGVGDATLAAVEGAMTVRAPIYTVTDDGKFVDYFGDAEGPAPRQLLLPTLGQALWYDIAALTNGATDQRERMPVAFFDRVACGTPAR
ncbi:MAG: hypothetical protein KF842_15350 [Caulobacter sp.]|nr:hypothetical protein [Caulobacter sp.]